MAPAERRSVLRLIKALFVSHQYRQCIQRCEEALPAEAYVSLTLFCPRMSNQEAKQVDPAYKLYLHFYLALSHECLARIMHDFSTSKIPEYAVAESCYLDAIDALSKATYLAQPKAEHIQQKTKGGQKHPHASDGGFFKDSPETPDSNGSHALERYDVLSQAHTPTRLGSHDSRTGRDTSLPFDPRPASTKASNLGCIFNWDFRATAQEGLIKSSSGTLLEPSTLLPRSNSSMHLLGVPPLLPRSTSSMHLMEAPPLLQSDVWQEDDVFNDDVQKAASFSSFSGFSTPRLSPVPQPGESGSPTPRRRTAKEQHLVSSVLHEPGAAGGFYSPPASTTSTCVTRYNAHLDALRSQVRTHLEDLRILKTATFTLQAERASRRAQRTLFAPTKLPQSRSFWSFKDPQAQSAEKTARIEQGRARGWARERFDPQKYVKLAEDALAELKGSV